MSSKEEIPIPSEIKLHARSQILEVVFNDQAHFEFPAEYLRVYSSAAEVAALIAKGEVETGKENVNINDIKQVGSYAIQLSFDDGHDTGIYSWKTLYNLGKNFEDNWAHYLSKLESMGYVRQSVRTRTENSVVTVLYFVTLVKLFGKDKEDITLPEEVISINDLVSYLGKRGKKWAEVMTDEMVKVTLNKHFVDWNTPLHDGDEIAIVPQKRIIV